MQKQNFTYQGTQGKPLKKIITGRIKNRQACFNWQRNPLSLRPKFLIHEQ